MRRHAISLPERTAELFVPYQRVAMRVISQAFRDLECPAEAAAARAFLTGSPMLRHWSAVAALDATSIIECARLLIARIDGPPRQGGAAAVRPAAESHPSC
jgi:hypothetical protein